jgi:hypothetical protein
MIDRLRSVFRNHGEATAMLGGGAAILVVIVIGILVLQSAMLPTGRRTPASVPTTPSPSASFAVAYASASGSVPASTATPLASGIDEEGGYLESPDLEAPTATPDATTAPTAKPTPRPTATPEPTRTPTPTATPTDDGSVKLIVRDARNGYESHIFHIAKGDSVAATVELIVNDLDRSLCSLIQAVRPDDPAIAARDIALEPLAKQTVDIFDGWNTFSATCATETGPVGTSLRAVARDGQPEACKGFEFARDDISVTSFDELTSGVIGTWVGCATTPWTPMYKVTFVLRTDGTYSAKSGEGLDGQRMVALYYGTDKDSSFKRYYLTDLQASGLGLGEIDVYFGSDSVVRDDLRNIRLMGDKLEFEMFHDGAYGPITFRLNRVR